MQNHSQGWICVYINVCSYWICVYVVGFWDGLSLGVACLTGGISWYMCTIVSRRYLRREGLG